MDAAEKLMKHFGAYEKEDQQKTDPQASLLHAIASGNGNGFKPLAVDLEKPQAGEKPSAFLPGLTTSATDGGPHDHCERHAVAVLAHEWRELQRCLAPITHK